MATDHKPTDARTAGRPAEQPTDRSASQPTGKSQPTAKPTPAPTPAAEPQKSKSLAELRAEATSARNELAGTLDAIELKLNLPYQAKLRARRARYGLRTLGDENPLALVGIIVGAVAIAGGAVWLGVRAVQRR